MDKLNKFYLRNDKVEKNQNKFGFIQTININEIGEYNYLFYLQVPKKNEQKISFNFEIKFYVEELQYPAYNAQKTLIYKNNEYFYLIGCINGKNSQKIKIFDKIWEKNQNKLEKRNFPSSNLCESLNI